MERLKENVRDCLQDLKGSGKFAGIRTADFIFPGLEVNGIGEISYPINQLQANSLIQVAQKAPFGKGSQTLQDNAVRSAWEIEANELRFNNPAWNDFLDTAVKNVKIDLGLEDYSVVAHLYKLLVYEEGDFFLPHKDSEKEKGMFGSLIVGLPSQYSGGELVIHFEGKEEIADFAAKNSNHTINYAGFYADCDHEVKPLTSGVRVCLVYNLIQQKAGKMMKPLSLQTNANKLAGLFTENNSLNLPYIILLGHQYTPANFSEQALKLNDRAKAEALLLAAKQAGYYAKFCLVTSYLTGSPEYNDHYDENDTEMGEVFEEDLYIEHWLDHKLPTFDYISFEENQLITSFRLNEEEPLIKESTGYMGNYGPDVMHWYHYGAMMIWSPEVNAQLLLAQNTATQLRWISYFNSVEKISDAEVMAIEDILINGFESRYRGGKKEDFNVVANWLINRNEKTFLINLNRERLQFFFVKIDTDSWIRLLQFMAVEHTKRLFEKIIEQVTLPVLEKLLEVLNAMTDKAELKPIAIEQTILLPDLFQSVHANTSREINATAISDLFQLAQIPTEKEWTNEIFETITEKPNWEYLHKVLVPQLMAATNPSGLTEKLLSFCHEYLQKRVNNKPQPPADWSRSLPETKNSKAQWQILKDFLESPSEIVFDFRRKQMERTDMEAAIRNVVIDLKTETIRKGSPHILRISKTQDAYNRLLKNWLTDVALLGRLK